MENLIKGLHHITSFASNPQQNVDFYAGILGLRLVKKTVNFDAPDIYHLYYGDELGQPGSILTFFPYDGIAKGRKGNGQVTVTSFSIPENSLEYWMRRLDKFNISYHKPAQHFNRETSIYFEDRDGMGIELVANSEDKRPGFSYGQIPPEYAIKGFYGITIAQSDPRATTAILTEDMEHKTILEEENRVRFTTLDQPGSYVDIINDPKAQRGLGGGGTVHHVAFATPNDATQLDFRERLLKKGYLQPTPVLDRQYFHSIYFREPGGVLFEVATNDIGFAIDESKEHLGEELKLPEWEEPNRAQIEKGLQPVEVNIEKFRD
ncbi:ring-cleaving dioxygenase [Zunongwangia sp. F363]|uniref:Ring-cleaving dioxygenase n=1 Tax=Autumnicola tepida TaxID=3075595 RepID=A0ABU3CEA3_9FLAO|nr:ring-cleaving dioxygenase [Zunongwangia sp. F363]MDT0644675.1 ring-cleaving dioxygenase [Zunongwangia sp. F363]